MKKLLLIPIMFAACNIEVSTKKSTAQSVSFGLTNVNYREHHVKGMTYTVYYSGSSPCVVNVTKDSLECEYYKSQINNNVPE